MVRSISESSASPRQRAVAALSANMDMQLLGYAAAAAAVGVFVAASAQAEIVYTPADVVIGPDSSYILDIDNDGGSNLKITNMPLAPGYALLWVEGFGPENGSVITTFHLNEAQALNQGQLIAAGRTFISYGTFTYAPHMAMATPFGAGGDWANVTNKYLGVRFRTGNQFHYGWARLSVRVNSSTITAHLTAYAYESTANTPIHAGQRMEATEAPASDGATSHRSLGALARGAARSAETPTLH